MEVRVAEWSRRSDGRASDGDDDQDLPLLRRGRQASGDQVQALRDLAGYPARAGPERIRPGLGLHRPRIRQRVCIVTEDHPLFGRCDGLRRPGRFRAFLRGRSDLAADRFRVGDALHGHHPRHHGLCDTRSAHPERLSCQRPRHRLSDGRIPRTRSG